MKTLVEKYMEVLNCTKEEAERYAHENVMRIRQAIPQTTETMAIYSLTNTLSS